MDNAVLNIINWFLGLITLVFTLLTIYGGIKYFLARGNKEKENRAGKMFLYGLISLFVMMLLYAITSPINIAPPLN